MVRNACHPARDLMIGLEPLKVRVPQVAQTPQEVAPHAFTLKYRNAVSEPTNPPAGCLPVLI
jgi:hypothetical protein